MAVDGEIVWAEGFRWADLENQTPVTPATLFRIGSVSETLTAAAVGLLSERGRLDLDAPVQHYVPSFPEKEWPVSTRQLMAHTAGVRPYRGEGGIFRGASCVDDAERLAIFAGDPLQLRPATEYHYSTYGWVLVGAVVAAAAKEPYLDFMQREILELQTPVRLVSGELTGQALGWSVRSALMGPDGAPTLIVGQGLGEVVLRSPLSATTVGGQVAGATASLLTVPEHRIAIAVATNVSGAENVSLLSSRLADAFLRLLPAR